jgi:hypothetical protein
LGGFAIGNLTAGVDSAPQHAYTKPSRLDEATSWPTRHHDPSICRTKPVVLRNQPVLTSPQSLDLEEAIRISGGLKEQLMVGFSKHSDVRRWYRDTLSIGDKAVHAPDYKGTVVNLIMVRILHLLLSVTALPTPTEEREKAKAWNHI